MSQWTFWIEMSITWISCVGLTFACCQIPTQPISHSPSSITQRKKIRWKSLWVEIKAGRSLTSYHLGQTVLIWGKYFPYFRMESFLGYSVQFLCGSFPQAAVLQDWSMWSHHGLGGSFCSWTWSTSSYFFTDFGICGVVSPTFSITLSPAPPVPFLKYGFPEVPPSLLYPIYSAPIS